VMLLCGSVLADTFYLQADFPVNPEPDANDPSWWYDAPAGGNQMTTNDAFEGNLFDINEFDFRNFQTNATFHFGGTLVRDDATGAIYMYAKSAALGGLEWLSDATRNESMRMRNSNIDLTITNMNVDALMIIRANSTELNLDLHALSLTGGGTLEFGTDSPEEDTGIWGLDIDNSAFTGTISVAVGNLKINDTLALPDANLSVSSLSSEVILSSNATFYSANYGPDVIPAGTYTAAQLNDELGTANFSGAGTLTVLTDNIETFYLQATRTRSSNNSDPDYYETAQQWWWDDPVAGNNMTNVVGATFSGNRFELNGYDYNTWNGSTFTASQNFKYQFGGTLVKNDEYMYLWCGNWIADGLHVTTNSGTTGFKGFVLRRSDAVATVTSLKLDGLLMIRANTTEQNLTLNVTKLYGDGKLQFGRDDTLGEDGDSTWVLDIDNSTFAGTIRADVGNLLFNDTLSLPNATLEVDAGSTYVSVILSNDATFAAVNLGATSVPNGDYTAAELNALLGGSRFAGSGILTVGTPPPGLQYAAWLELYPGMGALTNLTDDVEPDGLNNLLEYALGGNPTTDDAAAILPVPSTETGWLNLIYQQREDAGDVGLTYTVVTDTDLVFGTMTNEVPLHGVSGTAVDGYVTATNRISTATDPQAFMQLKVQLD